MLLCIQTADSKNEMISTFTVETFSPKATNKTSIFWFSSDSYQWQFLDSEMKSLASSSSSSSGLLVVVSDGAFKYWHHSEYHFTLLLDISTHSFRIRLRVSFTFGIFSWYVRLSVRAAAFFLPQQKKMKIKNVNKC